MDAKKFLEEVRRMRRSGVCVNRPIGCGESACLSDSPQEDWTSEEIERIVSFVEKWSEENPKKTRLMDFLEKYPNAPIDEDGAPTLLPWSLGYCGDTPCYACEKAKVKSLKWCWEQEVEEE